MLLFTVAPPFLAADVMEEPDKEKEKEKEPLILDGSGVLRRKCPSWGTALDKEGRFSVQREFMREKAHEVTLQVPGLQISPK